MTFGITFVDGEVPARAGGQLFLKAIPADGSCLQLFRNGILGRPEFGDYSLVAGQIIVPNPAPEESDKFVAFYRTLEPTA
jgi:hypothetical protein